MNDRLTPDICQQKTSSSVCDLHLILLQLVGVSRRLLVTQNGTDFYPLQLSFTNSSDSIEGVYNPRQLCGFDPGQLHQLLVPLSIQVAEISPAGIGSVSHILPR